MGPGVIAASERSVLELIVDDLSPPFPHPRRDFAQSENRPADVPIDWQIRSSAASTFGQTAPTAAAAASKAFQSLSQNVRVSTPEGEGRTLEDIVVAMLKPMVKDWLDANLPAIVEEKVEEEVQRLARRRR